MTAHAALGAPASAPGAAVSFQQRLESSRAGRWLISLFLVATVGGIVVANLPDGERKDRLAEITQPYMNATGLDQRWSMFSTPRRQVMYLEARVEHADGTVTVWRPPTGEPLVASYADTRWRKLVEHAVPTGGADTWPGLFEPVARYAAAQSEGDGSPAVKVTLVKRSADNLPPGDGPDRTPFREESFYSLRLR
jgi:hypothetical protein